MISQGPSVCVFSKENTQEVLASWLFVQYLLSNPIQLGYAETEGYLPVTTKAQESPEYRDYLDRAGEDAAHYTVKIQASRLLMDHIADTFVTPGFNGSASLRSAAGQMIENPCKNARRKAKMNDEAIEKIFSDVSSLYRLEQTGGKAAAQPLPKSAWILLGAIAGIWILIGLYRGRTAWINRAKKGK